MNNKLNISGYENVIMHEGNMDFIVVQWPEIQEYMDLNGFDENSYLINDEKGINDFGSSAYFVNKEWYEKVNNTFI